MARKLIKKKMFSGLVTLGKHLIVASLMIGLGQQILRKMFSIELDLTVFSDIDLNEHWKDIMEQLIGEQIELLEESQDGTQTD